MFLSVLGTGLDFTEFAVPALQACACAVIEVCLATMQAIKLLAVARVATDTLPRGIT